MSVTRAISAFDGLAVRVQHLLHFFSITETSATATSTAVGKASAQKPMSENKRLTLAQEAKEALNSVLFAIDAYGRYGLLAVANQFPAPHPAPALSLASLSNDNLRKELSNRAKRLYKENPAEIIKLRKYLLEFSQDRISKAGD